MKAALCFLPVLSLAFAFPRVARADLGYDKNANGGFITSLIQDGNELWSGTAGQGISHLKAGKWTHYTVKDGLGDNDVYALAHDRLGRVWVGHLNHGVSVWNGKQWKNYGITEGPLGERVFAIATSPVDGDVWIATNAGLTRYSLKNDTWSHYTRATGLPTIEISCLAFDAKGSLWVGTQHDGLLVSDPKENFKNWRRIQGVSALPMASSGEGLPSNFINDVLVTRENQIFVATDMGLAQSDNYGKSWTFLRGRDWRDKAEASEKEPKTLVSSEVQSKELLAEDYVTKLAQDNRGMLWVGYRRAGYEVRRPSAHGTPLLYSKDQVGRSSHISSIVPLRDGTAALGDYNDGVTQSDPVPSLVAASVERKVSAQINPENTGSKTQVNVPFPSPLGAPSTEELNRLLQLVKNRQVTPKGAPPITVLPSDWATQGDWRGRYGRYWASLNAMLAPRNYTWGAGNQPIYLVPHLGLGATKGDSMRYRVKTLYTDDRRVLEMPTIYFDSRLSRGLSNQAGGLSEQKNRRESEWDDNGKAYPLSKDGPDLYVTIKIPDGNYVLSLYNQDTEKRDGSDQERDYKISVRPHDYTKSLYEIEDFDQRPEWVQSRQRDFWGGEWKKFAVQGPQDFTIKVGRNHSVDTILSGMFLDEINEEPEPYFDVPVAGAPVQSVSLQSGNATPEDRVAEQLWTALQSAKSDDVLWWSSESRMFYQALLRHYQKQATGAELSQSSALWSHLGTCYYQLNLYPQWEQTQEKRGLIPARTIETSLKWDGKSNFDGHGRATIIAYRAGKSLTQAILDEEQGCACHPNG